MPAHKFGMRTSVLLATKLYCGKWEYCGGTCSNIVTLYDFVKESISSLKEEFFTL